MTSILKAPACEHVYCTLSSRIECTRSSRGNKVPCWI
jgi:hypothetical protein